jgi:hypothetical protein
LPRRGSELFVLMEDDLPPPYNLAINSRWQGGLLLLMMELHCIKM